MAKATYWIEVRRGRSAIGSGHALSVPRMPGTRFVGSRTSVVLAAANDRTRVSSKRRCLDCHGSGKE
ncbi:hypothetical protein OEB94_18800 [Streptomyces sp. ICN988]|uniref:hypothetical protein n=1 Tax=Streptomyces sp. ICN988 TaxID=2983765 RepID=UPI0021E460FF|nr:hypothetical protein [Streptomyces sp. ICN988]MCV2461327.1 hypothetical protein [Streptomyces sp. ICN988]